MHAHVTACVLLPQTTQVCLASQAAVGHHQTAGYSGPVEWRSSTHKVTALALPPHTHTPGGPPELGGPPLPKGSLRLPTPYNHHTLNRRHRRHVDAPQPGPPLLLMRLSSPTPAPAAAAATAQWGLTIQQAPQEFSAPRCWPQQSPAPSEQLSVARKVDMSTRTHCGMAACCALLSTLAAISATSLLVSYKKIFVAAGAPAAPPGPPAARALDAAPEGAAAAAAGEEPVPAPFAKLSAAALVATLVSAADVLLSLFTLPTCAPL